VLCVGRSCGASWSLRAAAACTFGIGVLVHKGLKSAGAVDAHASSEIPTCQPAGPLLLSRDTPPRRVGGTMVCWTHSAKPRDS
jgi:hypothetical protein